jgi:predicted regulator of Ras-like GTPase activity (Roadblock/LC7/MglB family)
VKARRRRRRTRPESERDQTESAFTPCLRRLWLSSRNVLAVVFVDGEGEAVDYCASIPPYDAKVLGAHMLIVLQRVVAGVEKIGFGTPNELEILGAERDILLRRVSNDYALIVSASTGGLDRVVLAGIEKCVDELRREAAIDVPAWEPHAEPLDVFVREAVGWEYAPAVVHLDGEWTEVADVLGRWVDDQQSRRVCFRVRTRGGIELTLAHDAEIDRWTVLTEQW